MATNRNMELQSQLRTARQIKNSPAVWEHKKKLAKMARGKGVKHELQGINRTPVGNAVEESS